MKLKKNLILTAIIAISVFVSSTSYASEKDQVSIKVNEEALSKMANKVDKNTIFAEDSIGLPQEEKDNKINGNDKPTEEKPENPNLIVKPQTQKDENPKKPENEDKQDSSEASKNDKEVLDDKKNPDKLDKDKNSNKNPVDENENPEKQDLSSDKENSNQVIVQEEEKNPQSPNFELIHRLESIKIEDNSQNKSYIGSFNPNTGTLQKLTSKETLTTSFKDKGGNLRLNLANINDDESIAGKKESQFIIRPQTIIILIAILAAIISAISIAIKGSRAKNKEQNIY